MPLTIYILQPQLVFIILSLFKFAINEFKNKNRTEMIIWCLKDNEPSREFYTKMGGTVVLGL